MNRGLAGVLGLPVDTVQNVANLALAGVGTVATAAGRPDLAPNLLERSFGGSDWISGQMERGGINTSNPRPDDLASRALHTGGMLAASGGRRPVAPAVGGVVAQETLGPEYIGVGAMTPAATAQAASGVKNAIASRTAANVQTFKDAGITPTIGQATEANFLQGLESLLSKFPGGQGVFRQFADYQQRKLGESVKTGVSAEDAGRAIEKGITGESGFVSRFTQTQDELYGQLDKFIPPSTSVNVSRTKAALADLNADIPGAPNLSEWFKNAKIQGIETALKADTSGPAAANANMPIFRLGMLKTLPLDASDKRAIFAAFNKGELPYEAVKKLRSLVGRELTDASIASSVPKSKWKALYAALSDDLGASAESRGARAQEAWQRASRYTRVGMDRIDDILDRVVGKTPEETFSRFMPKDPDQANKVRAVMRSLEPAERQVVTDAVVNRLGRATPGRQNEYGEVFSSETFLTNWNRLSEGAKTQLFSDARMRQNLDKVASVSANIRDGSKVFANPSGSGAAGAAYVLGGGGVGSAVVGNVAPLAVAGSLIAGANASARLMTNAKFVEWLARASTTQPKNGTLLLAQLGVVYNSLQDDDSKRDLTEFMQTLGPKK